MQHCFINSKLQRERQTDRHPDKDRHRKRKNTGHILYIIYITYGLVWFGFIAYQTLLVI